MNSLTGDLSRFRNDKIAMLADVEAMFHQINVGPLHTDALCFLRWENGDLSKEPNLCQMLVYLFEQYHLQLVPTLVCVKLLSSLAISTNMSSLLSSTTISMLMIISFHHHWSRKQTMFIVIRLVFSHVEVSI